MVEKGPFFVLSLFGRLDSLPDLRAFVQSRAYRRVKGAWWPPRSSKPLSARKRVGVCSIRTLSTNLFTLGEVRSRAASMGSGKEVIRCVARADS